MKNNVECKAKNLNINNKLSFNINDLDHNLSFDLKEVKEQARNSWDNIYKHFEVDVFPKNKQKACPICGGKDRFTYDDKRGGGDYFCRQCEPHSGDGLELLKRVKGWGLNQTIHSLILTGLPEARQSGR